MAGRVEEKASLSMMYRDGKLVSKVVASCQAVALQVSPPENCRVTSVGPGRGVLGKAASPKAEIEIYLRTTIPCRRADLVMVSSSDSDEHSEPSE